VYHHVALDIGTQHLVQHATKPDGRNISKVDDDEA
jgi:hypothetical protein